MAIIYIYRSKYGDQETQETLKSRLLFETKIGIWRNSSPNKKNLGWKGGGFVRQS